MEIKTKFDIDDKVCFKAFIRGEGGTLLPEINVHDGACTGISRYSNSVGLLCFIEGKVKNIFVEGTIKNPTIIYDICASFYNKNKRMNISLKLEERDLDFASTATHELPVCSN